jgi:hypothetical protein
MQLRIVIVRTNASLLVAEPPRAPWKGLTSGNYALQHSLVTGKITGNLPVSALRRNNT